MPSFDSTLQASEKEWRLQISPFIFHSCFCPIYICHSLPSAVPSLYGNLFLSRQSVNPSLFSYRFWSFPPSPPFIFRPIRLYSSLSFFYIHPFPPSRQSVHLFSFRFFLFPPSSPSTFLLLYSSVSSFYIFLLILLLASLSLFISFLSFFGSFPFHFMLLLGYMSAWDPQLLLPFLFLLFFFLLLLYSSFF